MECHACGRHVEAGDRFCNGCGTSLPAATDTQADATQADAAVVDDTDDDTDDDAHDAHDAHDDAGTDSGVREAESTIATPIVAATSELPRTELIETAPTADVWEAEPVWAPTDQVPTQPAPDAADVVATTDLPATEPITEVWMDRVSDEQPATTPYDFTEREPVAITGEIGEQPAVTAMLPTVSAAPVAGPRFGFPLILLIAVITGLVSLVALFANIITITSDVRLAQTGDTPAGFRTGTWILDDLADNMSIAGLIAILAMVAGGVASGFRWRWGSGLAGGAGLAMAGLAALAVGLAQFPIDLSHAFARVPTDDPFVLTITRDLGYWLLVAAGALGIVLFFASVNDAFGDRRAGLNPWIAALGALAIVVTAAGPLLPENQAIFSDNWYLIEGVGEASALLLVGRLMQLGLFLIGGVVGFLSVRRWGLGVALGVSLPVVWLVVSTLLELTDRPVGLGYGNPGAADLQVHGVTIIGASAVLAMLVLALVGAYDQGVRERH